MKNKQMKSILIKLGISILPISVLSCKTATDKPNILFIMADDLGKEFISSYGAANIKTPNIDALAEHGMQFTNAYSMPQCTPTRVTLLTGKYPWRTGWVNHWDVPRWGVGYFDWKQRENKTVANIMKEMGYVTCAAGKWQVNDFRIEPNAMEKHGFDQWAMWTGSETNNPGSGRRYADPYINTREGSKTYEGAFGPDVFTDYLIDFMERHKDEPMFLYYPMVLPHGPFVPTPDEPYLEGNQERFEGMVRYIDKLVGRLVESLDNLDILNKTIVIFTTDNGSPGGMMGKIDGRNVKGGKAALEEPGTAIPFIVSCPGIVPEAVVTDALTDFTDLLPTFTELGGGKVPDDITIDGVSIAPLILGKKEDTDREWIMSMGRFPAILDEKGIRGRDDFASRVIRDKRYKVWVSEEKEITRLHDLLKDPWEENNLVNSEITEHKAALGKFQEVVNSLPDRDARPLYEPRNPNPWDRKP